MVFDAEEYFLSRAYAAPLSKRFAHFSRSVLPSSVPYDAQAHEARILMELRSDKLRQIEAYAPLDTVRDFRRLPFVTKADLRHRMEAFLSPQEPNETRWVKTTTGTTGNPIPVVYTAAFYFEVLHLSPRKIAARAGLSDRLAEWPVFCLAMNDKKNTPSTVLADPSDADWVSVQAHVDEREPASFDAIVDLMGTLQPACVVSKPSVLEQFATGICPPDLPRGAAPLFVISSASMLFPEVQEKMQERLGARVVDAYTMTEFGVIASACVNGNLHIDTTAVYVEAVDAEGQAVPELELGELVITSFANPALPLVRYRTGDMGRLTHVPCSCGVGGPRIAQLEGKKIACFVLPDGSAFSPTYFNDLFSRFPCLKEFQITQKSLSHYEITVEPNAYVPPQSVVTVLEDIRCHVRNALKGAQDVRIMVDRLASNGKFQRYRTEV